MDLNNFELTDDIKTVFEKHLPGMASGALLKFVEESNKLRDDFVTLKENYKSLEQSYTNEVKDKNTWKGSYNNLKQDVGNLEAREFQVNEKLQEIEKRERDLDYEILKTEFNSQQSRIQDHKEIIGLFTKNPVITKSIFESNSNNENEYIQGYNDANGAWIPDRNNSKCITKDYSKTETKEINKENKE